MIPINPSNTAYVPAVCIICGAPATALCAPLAHRCAASCVTAPIEPHCAEHAQRGPSDAPEEPKEPAHDDPPDQDPNNGDETNDLGSDYGTSPPDAPPPRPTLREADGECVHEWVVRPGNHPEVGPWDLCLHCGCGRFEEAHVYALEQSLEDERAAPQVAAPQPVPATQAQTSAGSMREAVRATAQRAAEGKLFKTGEEMGFRVPPPARSPPMADPMRDALEAYVTFHGPCAEHHRDDCPAPASCKPCRIDRMVNDALVAPNDATASTVDDRRRADAHLDTWGYDRRKATRSAAHAALMTIQHQARREGIGARVVDVASEVAKLASELSVGGVR